MRFVGVQRIGCVRWLRVVVFDYYMILDVIPVKYLRG